MLSLDEAAPSKLNRYLSLVCMRDRARGKGRQGVAI